MRTGEFHSDDNSARLQIYTFGRFMVRLDDVILTREKRRSKKLWQLFLYLLSNHGSEVPAEEIANQL